LAALTRAFDGGGKQVCTPLNNRHIPKQKSSPSRSLIVHQMKRLCWQSIQRQLTVAKELPLGVFEVIQLTCGEQRDFAYQFRWMIPEL